MFSRDLFSNHLPSLRLNLTVDTLAKLKSTKPLSSLPSENTEMVMFKKVCMKKNITSVVTQ